MMSDYCFLEDVSRRTDTAARENLRPVSRISADGVGMTTSSNRGEYKNKTFGRLAKKQGVNVVIMSRGMKRHEQNCSIWQPKQKQIHWTVEWIFHDATGGSLTIIDDRIPERTTLEDALSKHLDPTKENNAATRFRLQEYVTMGSRSVKCVMRKQFVPANKVQYFKLTNTETLSDTLNHRQIVEFPTIDVYTTLPELVSSNLVDDRPVVLDKKSEEDHGLKEKEEEDTSVVMTDEVSKDPPLFFVDGVGNGQNLEFPHMAIH